MIVFVLANSADADDMSHYAALHLDLHCLQIKTFGIHYRPSLKIFLIISTKTHVVGTQKNRLNETVL